MKLAALPVAILALAQPATAPPPAPVEAATAVDRLQWNARERTAAGKSALDAGRGERAVPAFDTALRLAPANPTTRFNAGTARLAGDPAGALPLLEQAARSAPPELAPSAWYNLGNGRLATGDAQGAVDAYVEALRRQPEHAHAKVNLELALRELERQQRERQKQEQEQQQNRQQERRQQGQGSGTGDSSDAREKSSAGSPPQSKQEPQPSTGSTPNAPGADPSSADSQSLPQFHDLPDMTRQQAAAILRAVENLERQQRRDRAEKEAAAKAQVEIDW